jgi:hypothetical protein
VISINPASAAAWSILIIVLSVVFYACGLQQLVESPAIDERIDLVFATITIVYQWKLTERNE